MSDDLESRRSRAIGAGLGIGVGIGAGWGIVMASMMEADVSLGMTFGAGIGATVALISGAAVYRELAKAASGSGSDDPPPT